MKPRRVGFAERSAARGAVVDESLLVWTAAIETGFVQQTEWVAWADRQIAQLDRPPMWILDLSLVHSSESALSVLWPACRNVPSDVWMKLDWTGVYLGFWYLRYKRGELSMLELLLRSGDKADGAGCRIDCSAFYVLANEIDGGGPTVPSNRPLADRIAELFMPLAELAKFAWSKLIRAA